jgi:hypothetical protein
MMRLSYQSLYIKSILIVNFVTKHTKSLSWDAGNSQYEIGYHLLLPKYNQASKSLVGLNKLISKDQMLIRIGLNFIGLFCILDKSQFRAIFEE